jgi:hypothetical protein
MGVWNGPTLRKWNQSFVVLGSFLHLLMHGTIKLECLLQPGLSRLVKYLWVLQQRAHLRVERT